MEAMNTETHLDESVASAYDASSIKVMTEAEMMTNFADPRHDWMRAEVWARQYCRDVAWIKRSIAACRESGKSLDYFVSRYLEKNADVPLDSTVNATALELMRDRR